MNHTQMKGTEGNMTIVDKTLTTDATLLTTLLSSKPNLIKLGKAGYKTKGDLKEVTMSELMELGIGEVTLEEIQGVIGTPKPEEHVEPTIEENDNDICIRSPHARFSLQVVPGDIDRGPSGRGMRPIQPLYLTCIDGRGNLSRKMWFIHLYGRGDMASVEQAERDNKKWRVDAFKWLKSRKACGRKFHIMSD
jgi:hypothetical protein